MIMNAAILKEVLDKCPDEFEIFYNDVPVSDRIEIDVSGKRIILKND